MLRPFLLRAPLPDNASHYFLLSLRAGLQTGVAIRPPFALPPNPAQGWGSTPPTPHFLPCAAAR